VFDTKSPKYLEMAQGHISLSNPKAKCLTLNLGLWIQGKPKHVETSKDIRNDHKISPLMDFSETKTLKCSKPRKDPGKP
jgi:hypothetical protein